MSVFVLLPESMVEEVGCGEVAERCMGRSNEINEIKVLA